MSTMNTLTHQQIREFNASRNCLQGKVILVTGAGDGIGKEAALSYARYGATVLLLGRTISKLEYVYESIEDNHGARPAIIPMHLENATEADMHKVYQHIDAEFGKLDGILHNASELGDMSTLANYDVTMFDKVMRTNFHSVFIMTQALLPLLEKSDNASVVFTTSSVGAKPRALWGAYALSKQAVEGMCDLFTQEMLESNIRFNCINPGGIRTRMRAHAYPQEDPNTLKIPADIMPGYVCFMADESIATKGQVVALQPK